MIQDLVKKDLGYRFIPWLLNANRSVKWARICGVPDFKRPSSCVVSIAFQSVDSRLAVRRNHRHEIP
jgi:hypothetical protein